MSGLTVNIPIKIQRTNGMIQLAEVTSINSEARVVTAEWNEGEVVKAKEVDFEQVFRLNPNLVQTTLPANPVPTNLSATTATPAVRKNNAAQSMLPRASVAIPQGSLRVRQANNRQTLANGSVASHELHSGSASASNSNYHNNNIACSSNGNTVVMSNNNSNAANSRRSNAVKEVEKIKKQREERRARQAEQKAEKTELMSACDPTSHSQWEFLSMIREYRAQLELNPITLADTAYDQQICVAVRKRPLNNREAARKDIDVITIPTKDIVIVHEPKQKVDLTKFLENQKFRFDYSFDESTDNELVYKYTARPLVKTIFQGGMATCFAYGQTGSGKTHTMGGDFHGKTQDSSKGIYALTARDVFAQLSLNNQQGEGLYVSASFFEIYSGKVFDLLNNKEKLRVLEDARSQVQIVGLSERKVASVDEVLRLIQMGNNIRTSGVTSANNHSSRSHAVFQLILKKSNNKLKGKFSLIDLAGNERGADTSSANRQTRMEGAEINKSLLALKECIRALGRKGAHLPFRTSKLTQVLRDSFIGENSRTCMIAMISPGFQSCEHTLNTLRYANRVKELGADSAEQRMADEEDDLANGEVDLASSNDDLFNNINQAISHITELEEDVLDTHRAVYEEMMREHKQLIEMSNLVDYDVDAFLHNLKELMLKQKSLSDTLMDKVNALEKELRDEELIAASHNGRGGNH